ncbi:TetR/AcrR family transcriptional regulator [uncultured Roseibium sp.]|uniref:TetR/AcrR family transcriptional regulator n=1 Tax=uncultured Roseibium sp. TaxID=1936171 RepID=UPI0026084D06|nr:TetR/AcrR family transcriptional regulator [uncultured Roseibium sp.]
MNEREQNIVEAAIKLFAHYGVRKTSMTEIAAAAKVSRQTLYNSFECKEDLIFAALLCCGKMTKEAIERDCAQVADPGNRLDILFEHMGAIPFKAMHRLPHFNEVLDVGDNFEPERKAQIKDNYINAVRLVLAPYEKGLVQAGIEPIQLSKLTFSVFTQIKRDANDVEGLRDLFEPMRGVIIASIQ